MLLENCSSQDGWASTVHAFMQRKLIMNYTQLLDWEKWGFPLWLPSHYYESLIYTTLYDLSAAVKPIGIYSKHLFWLKSQRQLIHTQLLMQNLSECPLHTFCCQALSMHSDLLFDSIWLWHTLAEQLEERHDKETVNCSNIQLTEAVVSFFWRLFAHSVGSAGVRACIQDVLPLDL